MKLARITIENFRQIDSLELDFTDSFGRVRDRTILVGPNGCGKTTILDAVAAALGPTSELPATRPHFRLSPATVVRRGALRAQVECHLHFLQKRSPPPAKPSPSMKTRTRCRTPKMWR
jgi:predicted ATP-binding protein involved in virulence